MENRLPGISRRDFLRFGGGAGLGLLFYGGLPSPEPAGAQGIETIARGTIVPVREGSYFPAGRGLRGHLEAFAQAHFNRTGEDVNPNINRLLNNFTGRFATDLATGLCNGYSNYQALAETVPPASVDGWGQALSRQDLDAVGTTLHYDDPPVVETFGNEEFGEKTYNRSEKGWPIFFHNMLWKYLGEQGERAVINRSTNPSEVWTNPVDYMEMQIQRFGNGWARVEVLLRAGNYTEQPEHGLPYRWFKATYEIEENNPWEEGRWLGTPGRKIIRPDGSTVTEIRPRSIWRPDPTRYLAGYQIDGNVMTDSMIETYNLAVAA